MNLLCTVIMPVLEQQPSKDLEAGDVILFSFTYVYKNLALQLYYNAFRRSSDLSVNIEFKYLLTITVNNSKTLKQ